MPSSSSRNETPSHTKDAPGDRCLHLLSALARQSAVLIPPENPEDPVATVVAFTEGKEQSRGAFAVADMDAAVAQGWIEPSRSGWGFRITRAGLAVVRAARTAATTHRAAAGIDRTPATIRTAAPRPVSRTTTKRDIGGSLAWLHSRRDKDGQPMISAEQLAAGERLAGDLWRARMTPRVTAVWTGVPGNGSGRRSAPGAGVDIADAVVAAKVRVERALKAVGPEFAGALIDVCGHALGLDDIERINGLPMRSGKMLLRTALTRLARHYGYLPPEHGDAEIARRIAGWMAEGAQTTL